MEKRMAFMTVQPSATTKVSSITEKKSTSLAIPRVYASRAASKASRWAGCKFSKKGYRGGALVTKSEEARWQLEQWNENCAVARSEARLSRLFRMPSEPTRSHHRGMTRWRCTGQVIFVAKPGQ